MLKFDLYKGKPLLVDKIKENYLFQSLKTLWSFIGKNHGFIIDSYFSSTEFSQYMTENKLVYIGIINKNKLRVHKEIKNNKIEQGKSEF